MSSQYYLSTTAKQQAYELSITDESLENMLTKSAKVTHEYGNRRYHDYLFDTQGLEVFSIYNINTVFEDVEKCQACRGRKKISVFDECPHCEGIGCPKCDKGLVGRSIACPECNTHKTLWNRKHI